MGRAIRSRERCESAASFYITTVKKKAYGTTRLLVLIDLGLYNAVIKPAQ